MSDHISGLAERITKLRELSGLDLAEMSRLAGLKSEAHVGMLVRGDVKSPAPSTLTGIARAFGVTVDWLITGDGPAPSPRRVQRAVKLARAQRQTEAA